MSLAHDLPDPGQSSRGTHMGTAGVGPDLPAGHVAHGTQHSLAGGDPSASGGQLGTGTHGTAAAAGTTSTDDGHRTSDTHQAAAAVGDSQQDGAKAVTTPVARSPRPADALLAIYADALDDFERVRIATENRLRSLAQVKGLDDTPEAERMAATADALAALEHGVELELKRAMRAHPLGPWVKRAKGVGEKQAARLLAAIGDPTTRANPAQLWAYCGYAPGQKRRKGVKSNWSTVAKSRAYLIAEAAVKAGVRKGEGCDDEDGYDVAHRYAISDLGQCYLDRRTRTAETHAEDWTPGHRHNDALRYVAKRVLRNLWREARRLEQDGAA